MGLEGNSQMRYEKISPDVTLQKIIEDIDCIQNMLSMNLKTCADGLRFDNMDKIKNIVNKTKNYSGSIDGLEKRLLLPLDLYVFDPILRERVAKIPLASYEIVCNFISGKGNRFNNFQSIRDVDSMNVVRNSDFVGNSKNFDGDQIKILQKNIKSEALKQIGLVMGF